MRITKTFHLPTDPIFKEKLLAWAQQFSEVVWLDSNSYVQEYGTYEALLAVDAFTAIQTDEVDAFEKLDEYQQKTKDWLFGYLSYDVKNDTENLISQNKDGLGFPELVFFQPKKIIKILSDTLEFEYLNFCRDEMASDYTEIINFSIPHLKAVPHEKAKISLRLTKDQYKQQVQTMKDHIAKGNIYEANFCQEFYAENTPIDPLTVFNALNAISKAPFACFFKNYDHFALCASPERYLKKIGTQVISQPIKGTAPRAANKKEDALLKQELADNKKEQSENVMIVDLVRNDLSKTAQKGSVQVLELCKAYSFEQVHQLISTISSTVAPEVSPIEVLKTTFPMGSMTGAPKLSAMQIIEALEASKRGLYSGAIGYITPSGDFDFNVVIRSILYNESRKYVSFSVGSAITAKSQIEKEYEECLLKAKAMREVLQTS